VALTRYEGIGLAVLNGAGPVIRERALVGAEVVFEAQKSTHAQAATAATMERRDTDRLRRLAGGHGPMTLDRDTIVVRLAMMNDLLCDLESLGWVDSLRLRPDRIARHAVERILTQRVEFAVSINSHVAASVSGSVPGTYRDSFRAAADAGLLTADLVERLAPSAGLRNVLTHEYVGVALDLLAAGAGAALVDHRVYVRAAARSLQGQ
jgi:uncharacterized protein YutE (UPF0331/DUF86 family)